MTDNVDRMMYPGFRWLAGSTAGWKDAPPQPFAWVAYGPPDTDGVSVVSRGFAESQADAEATAQAVAEMSP